MSIIESEKISNLKKELLRQKELLLQIYLHNIQPNNKIYNVDFVFYGAINKSLANISAFVNLVEDKNYLVAFSIIRMHLDTLLRFYAVILLDMNSREKYLDTFLSGDRIDKLQVSVKNEKGKNIKKSLNDRFLCENFEKTFSVDWVLRVYQETSNFVHMSGIYFHSMIGKTNKEGEHLKFNMGIHKDGQIKIKEKNLEEAYACINDITHHLILCLNLWLDEKHQKI